MKDKDWFPSKKLIDETALKMKEAHDKGFEAEYKNKKIALVNLLYTDVLAKGGLHYIKPLYEEIFQKLVFEPTINGDIMDVWSKKEYTESSSFTNYLAVTISKRSKPLLDFVYSSEQAYTESHKKKIDEMTDSEVTYNEDGEELSLYDKAPSYDDDIDPEKLENIRQVLDIFKAVIDKTRQKNSKICKRTFSSEQIMLYYIPYSDGRLLKQVSTQFEAVTYYSLFGFLMESDIIDPATVNSIDDIFKCHVPQKYYTKEGKEIKMIPHSVTCEYLQKFHEVEKTASQLSDIYRSYMEAMNMTRYHN